MLNNYITTIENNMKQLFTNFNGILVNYLMITLENIVTMKKIC